MVIIKFKKLCEDAIIPVYAHGPNEDAGMDLYAAGGYELYADTPILVKTGIAIEMPPGVEGQIRSRSGLALKRGICVYNAPGTVDPSYRGELGVILCWNGYMGKAEGVVKDWFHFTRINKGDRIAQIVFAPYVMVSMQEAELSSTERGEGGFGSTGN